MLLTAAASLYFYDFSIIIHFANEFHMGLVKLTKQFSGQKLSAMTPDDADTTMYWLCRQLYCEQRQFCLFL